MKILLALTLIFPSLFAQPKAKAELLFFPDNENPKLGIWITLEKDWHIYWLNSGDSGMPTEINWRLPEGLNITETHWPIPKAFESDGFVSYGYDNNALILFDVSIENFSNIANKEINCKINSLICKEVCIPFDTTIYTKLSNIVSEQSFEKFLAENNIVFPKSDYSFNLSAFYQDDKVLLEMTNFDEEKQIKEISFFPFENGIFKNSLNNNFIINDEKYILELPYDQFKTRIPEKLEGILILRFDDDSSGKAFQLKLTIKN